MKSNSVFRIESNSVFRGSGFRGNGFRRIGTSLLLGIVAITLFVYLAPSVQAATNWYVTPTGAGSRNGQSPENAFQSIQQALNVVQPGDTIVLGDGNYYEALVSKRHGTANAPITLRGSANAIVRGTANEGRVFLLNHDYYVLDGWTINGHDGQGNQLSNYREKLLYVIGQQAQRGPRGLEVRNMRFSNAKGECIRLRYFVQYANIHHNTISNCGLQDFVFNGGAKNGEGIYVGTSSTQWGDGKNPTNEPDQANFNHIHHNIINTQGNECVDVKEGATRNLIEHNDCTGNKDPESAGLDARGSGNTFRYNTTYGNVGSGIRLGGHEVNGVLYGVDNAIYGNIIYGNANGGIKIQTDPQEAIRGNTFTGPNGQSQANITVGAHGGKYQQKAGAACDSIIDPPLPSATPTPTQSPASTPFPTTTPPATPSAQTNLLLLSATAGGSTGSITFKDEDIIAFDPVTRKWRLYFDGSDVGIASADVDAFAFAADSRLLFSFITETSVPGVGKVDDSDIVAFTAQTLGATTSGIFALYFDGSDVGLTSNGEDIDALSVLRDGILILHTIGSYDLPGVTGNQARLLAFTPQSLGDQTMGSWSAYRSSETAGLQSKSGISNLSIDEGAANGSALYWGADGVTSSTQASAPKTSDKNDLLSCSLTAGVACVLQPFWDGDQYGFGKYTIDALAMAPAQPLINAAQTEEVAEEDGGAEDDSEPFEETLIYQLFLPAAGN